MWKNHIKRNKYIVFRIANWRCDNSNNQFWRTKEKNLIRYLEESGLEVSVNESNKYGEMLGNKLGFTHDEIIIATKKAEQENKTHKIMDGI